MAPSKSAGDEERILSYHDGVLHRSELDIFRGPNYINDRFISFYFTHSLSLSSDILFIPPSVFFLISVCCPDDPLILSPFDLPSKTLILFPVNDNPDRAVAEGGTNWSRLVYDRASNEFVHRDSANGSNRWCARRLYEAVKGFVGGDGDTRIVWRGGGGRIVEGRTLQQRNVYDCGLFVMAIARVVCEWKERRDEEERWFGALEEEVDMEKVGRLRGEVLILITNLMERK